MNELLHKQQIFTLHVALLIDYIFKHGYMCTLGEVYRPKEMAQIYAKAHKGIVKSKHCERLAVDLNLFNSKDNLVTDFKEWEQFGKFWEKGGKEFVWGGRFVKDGKPWPDMSHFQMEQTMTRLCEDNIIEDSYAKCSEEGETSIYCGGTK